VTYFDPSTGGLFESDLIGDYGFGTPVTSEAFPQGGMMGGITMGGSIPLPGGGSFNLTASPGFGGGGTRQPDPKVVTTQIVDQYETALKNNLAMYQAGQRSKADALKTFDTLFAQMQQQLSAYGDTGRRAIAERTPGNSLTRWDWVAYYRDPIAGGTQNGGGLLDTVTGPITSGTGISSTTLLLIAAAVVVVILLRRK
jgi:hypothetical protein